MKVGTDGYTDILTDANRLYNLSHAIGYAIAMGQTNTNTPKIQASAYRSSKLKTPNLRVIEHYT